LGILKERGISKAERVFPKLPSVDAVKPQQKQDKSTNSGASISIDSILRMEPQLRATTLSTLNMHLYGNLYVNYLKARRDVFIVAKGWQLSEVDGMEFDQYDTPFARWIVVHENGEVMAGMRIAPTNARCGLHSYMIRDAQLGLLAGLPLDPLYFEAPVAEHMWEATRLFVTDKVASERRGEVQQLLMLEMAAAARSVGATYVIGIVPAVFKRWMHRIGMAAVAVGPKFELGGDWSQAALMHVSEAPDPFAKRA
jgi:acyl homoserine lactone synthase